MAVIVFLLLGAINRISDTLEKINKTLSEIKEQHKFLATSVHDIQELLQKGKES